MTFHVLFGTGKAHCKICNKKIMKIELQVTVIHGAGLNMIRESVHLECLNGIGDCIVAERG